MELSEEDLKLAGQACGRWADEIAKTLTSPRALAYNSIARQDMTETAKKLQLLSARFGMELHDD